MKTPGGIDRFVFTGASDRAGFARSACRAAALDVLDDVLHDLKGDVIPDFFEDRGLARAADLGIGQLGMERLCPALVAEAEGRFERALAFVDRRRDVEEARRVLELRFRPDD